MTTHTPGPWTYAQGRTGSNVYVIEGDQRADVAEILNAHAPEGIANARLIAATPELLAALTVAEAALGDNLVWITDRVDLQVRQGDADTLQRLAQLRDAWQTVVRVLAETQ